MSSFSYAKVGLKLTEKSELWNIRVAGCELFSKNHILSCRGNVAVMHVLQIPYVWFVTQILRWCIYTFSWYMHAAK